MLLALAEQPKYLIGRDFTFEAEKHIYRDMTGRVIPGNTTLLKEYGIVNLDGVPQERLDFKSALGTAVHYATHLWDTGDLDESSLDPRIEPYFRAYQKFREITGFEARFTELPLWSKKFGFCTTLDKQGPLVWKGIERESIIELKCVWEMQPSNMPQTAAQDIAFEENFKTIKNKSRFGLQLKETGDYDIQEYTNPRDRQVFLACIEIQRFREENHLIKGEK